MSYSLARAVAITNALMIIFTPNKKQDVGRFLIYARLQEKQFVSLHDFNSLRRCQVLFPILRRDEARSRKHWRTLGHLSQVALAGPAFP